MARVGLTSRTRLIEFAETHQIPIAKDKRGEAPFSVDANLLHSSSEGKVLEDPSVEPDSMVYMRTLSPEEAPDKASYVEIGFERGDAVSVDGVTVSPATLLTELNVLGRANGIGRLDLVENRFVGMKSRGVLRDAGRHHPAAAHRAMESITLDRGAAHLKDELMPRYAELIYNGFWFSPEREMLQVLIDKSQEFVAGTVRLKLYKGNVTVVGRASPYSLYSQDLVTFEDDRGAYDKKDAQGFIKLNALRLRTLGDAQAEADAMSANAEQIEYWNRLGGKWAALQERIDLAMNEITDAALAFACPAPGERMLDIGCGCGTTTLRLAMIAGRDGAAAGVDVSAPMLAVAEARAQAGLADVPFIEADASTYDFQPNFDLVFLALRRDVLRRSRCRLRSNIRNALARTGRLAFVCWRAFPENLWAAAPYAAAKGPVAPPQPPADPHAPGPFAFADGDRVRAILQQAGFRGIRIEKPRQHDEHGRYGRGRCRAGPGDRSAGARRCRG